MLPPHVYIKETPYRRLRCAPGIQVAVRQVPSSPPGPMVETMYLGGNTMRSLVVLLASLVSLACATVPVEPLESSKRAVVDASVEFLNLEGGCWTIEREQVHYLPLNLPEEFRHDGLRVRVELLRRDDYGSTCQVGPVVEVLSIRRL
jgi:hypothetical protein